MKRRLEEITGTLKADLGRWLEEDDEASRGLQELQGRLESLRPALGARAVAAASRALCGSTRSIRASRQREAADAIAAACRELGVILEPKAPLKRAPRRKAAKPEPIVKAPPTAPEAEAPRERGGFLTRSRAQ